MGIGGCNKEINPYVTAETPFLDEIMGEHSLMVHDTVKRGENWAIYPADTCLRVTGIPQSATGQTTILTGINAAKHIGKHLRGFPNLELRELIKRKNIYQELKKLGFASAFANVYRSESLDVLLEQEKYHSATTAAALSSGLRLRTIKDLLEGTGVFQDITNKILVDEYNLDVPIILPEQAGLRIANISQQYDFVLFEYFQTDVAGHKQDFERIKEILFELDQFIKGIVNAIDLSDTLVILTSDHGNIEDISSKNHTMNKVPTLLITNRRELLNQTVSSIEDIVPLVINTLTIGGKEIEFKETV